MKWKSECMNATPDCASQDQVAKREVCSGHLGNRVWMYLVTDLFIPFSWVKLTPSLWHFRWSELWTMSQWDRLESPVTNPCIFIQPSDSARTTFSIKVLRKLLIHMQKIETRTYHTPSSLSPHDKIYQICFKDLNTKNWNYRTIRRKNMGTISRHWYRQWHFG